MYLSFFDCIARCKSAWQYFVSAFRLWILDWSKFWTTVAVEEHQMWRIRRLSSRTATSKTRCERARKNPMTSLINRSDLLHDGPSFVRRRVHSISRIQPFVLQANPRRDLLRIVTKPSLLPKRRLRHGIRLGPARTLSSHGEYRAVPVHGFGSGKSHRTSRLRSRTPKFPIPALETVSRRYTQPETHSDKGQGCVLDGLGSTAWGLVNVPGSFPSSLRT